MILLKLKLSSFVAADGSERGDYCYLKIGRYWDYGEEDN